MHFHYIQKHGSKKKSAWGQAFAKACATRRSAQAEATDGTHSLPRAWHPPSVQEFQCQKQAPIRPFLASYRSSTALPCALSQLLLMDVVTLNYPCSTSVATTDATDISSVPLGPASHLVTLRISTFNFAHSSVSRANCTQISPWPILRETHSPYH